MTDEFSIFEIDKPILGLPILDSSKCTVNEIKGSYGDLYIVDLSNFSCTCLDWLENRVRFSIPDVRRACKHIVRHVGPEAFVLKGNRLAGFLVPIPSCNYRLEAFQVNESIIIFRQAEDRRWFDVVAPAKAYEETDRYFVFGTDGYRWSEQNVPKYGLPIKRFIREWVRRQSVNFDGVVPPLPPSARNSIAERERQTELDKEKCFVCRFPLSFSDKTPEAMFISCPRCKSFNVLTQSERTNTPERLR
ncbi:MAG TPA: hypothetical protein VK468_10410, partial [Pyrinomonadaceae bacterium]|nr:hypothetical protein [Pyrinomonadaceae bacterium]